MAELTTVARPYAKAAFQYARDAKDLAGWMQSLALAAAVARHETVEKLIESPSLTAEQKADRFIDVCGDEVSANMKNFVRTLADNQRLSLLPEICVLFEQLKAQQEKAIDVEVTTAFELSSEIETKLSNALSAKLDRDVQLQSSVDKSLLGGALVRAGDTVIDGTVRGRLAKLAEALTA